MPFVRNRVTGLTFEVPPGHYSLKSDLFEVLPEPGPEPVETQPEPVKKPAPRARTARKK